MAGAVYQSCGKAKISIWLGADRYLHIYFTISKHVNVVVSTFIFIKLTLTDHAELLMVQIQRNFNHLRVTWECCCRSAKLESGKCCLWRCCQNAALAHTGSGSRLGTVSWSNSRVSLIWFSWLCLLNVSKTRCPQQSHFLASSHRKWEQQHLLFHNSRVGGMLDYVRQELCSSCTQVNSDPLWQLGKQLMKAEGKCSLFLLPILCLLLCRSVSKINCLGEREKNQQALCISECHFALVFIQHLSRKEMAFFPPPHWILELSLYLMKCFLWKLCSWEWLTHQEELHKKRLK